MIRSLRANYDLAFWIECSFETALARALQRNQEKLSPQKDIETFARFRNNLSHKLRKITLKLESKK